MTELEIKGLSKSFDRSGAAVSDIDLAVRGGEFMVLVGPSGCGKSTTLRMIAGLEEPSGGTISIDGDDVTFRDPADRGVAMVFQSYALYPHMTVEGNMSFGLRIAGLPAAKIRERVQHAATTLQLESLLKRYPRQLSGGQRQRVAIGRAIVREPKVFLFDEPLSNLDAALRTQMRMELAALHRRLKATIVYVTHDQVEAMTLGSRIAVFNRGKIEQVGTPRELYEQPANEFVAGFIGSPAMNFISPKAAASFMVSPPAGIYRAGIRPENVRVELFAGGAGVRVPAAVERIEYLGDIAQLYCLLTDTQERIVVKHAIAQNWQPVTSETVYLTAQPQSIHCFDSNGTAIR